MTAVLLGDYEPDSPEWHAARRNGIGASEIAAVVGLSPFESAFSLWHRKKGNIAGPDPSNPLFYWGHALEPLVAQKFAADHPDLYVFDAGTYKSDKRDWQIANPDRLLSRYLYGDQDILSVESLLEIKTTRYGDNWGPSGSTAPNNIPIHVRCQVTQQMDVFAAPYAWVAVLIGGNDYREYRIDFDEADAAALRTAGAAFWESLQTNDEPPIDASFETYETVRELHPDIDGADVELTPALYDVYLNTKLAAEQAADAHRQIKSRLLAEIGDARRALVKGTPVLRRQPGRGGSVSLYPVKEAS